MRRPNPAAWPLARPLYRRARPHAHVLRRQCPVETGEHGVDNALAAAVGKLEDRAALDRHAAAHACAQTPLCTVQPGPNRRLVDAEAGRGFNATDSFNHAQYEYRAEDFRQCIDRLLEQLSRWRS